MKLKTKNFKGISALVMILGITAIAIAVVVTLALITYFESNSTFLRQKSSEALLIAESGVYDALYKISQNKNINIPDGYSLDFENGQATITIEKNMDESGPMPGFFMINSTGSTKAVIGKANKKLQIKAAIDETSGKITIISWKEIEATTDTPTSTPTPQLAVRSTPITGVAITSSSGHGGTTNYTIDVSAETSVTLTAPTVSGYTFSNWSGYISSTNNTINFLMPYSNTICIANYDLSFAIGPYRKKITIDQTKVDENLTDFPVLVKLTSSNFDFSKARSDGHDIRFTASDGTTLLKYERERHDSVNQVAEYWVKIPSVSSTANTDFYIYYGKSDATDGADPTNVWNSNIKGVWHLKENPSGTAPQMKDSTSNGNNGTSNGSMTSGDQVEGKIDGSLDFDGTDDYVGVSSSASLKPTEAITIEAWIRPNLQGTREFVATKWLGFTMELNTSNGATCGVYVDGGQRMTPSTSALPNNTWTHLVFTYDSGSKSLKTYVNGGQEIKSFILSGLTTYSMTVGDSALGIGKYSSYYWNGLIDEVRISNTARSAAWIKASYNSENNSLLTYGSEETGL